MDKAREENDIQDAFNVAFADVDFMGDGDELEDGSEMDRSTDESSEDSIMQLEELIHVEYCSDSTSSI